MSRVKPRVPVLQRGNLLTRGLVGYWALAEGAGTRAANAALPGVGDGTLVNAPTWQPSLVGPRLLFTRASDQYVNCGASSVFDITGSITVAAHYRLTTAPTDGYMLVAKDGDSGGRAYVLDVNRPTNGGARFYIDGGGGSSKEVRENRIPVAGDDRLVVGVYVPSTSLAIYIDGKEANRLTSAIPASIPTATAPLMLARRQYAGFEDPLDGSLRWAAIWNRALSASEIQQLTNEPYALVRLNRSRPLTLLMSGAGATPIADADGNTLQAFSGFAIDEPIPQATATAAATFGTTATAAPIPQATTTASAVFGTSATAAIGVQATARASAVFGTSANGHPVPQATATASAVFGTTITIPSVRDVPGAIVMALLGDPEIVSAFGHTSTNPRFHKDVDRRQGRISEGFTREDVYPVLIFNMAAGKYDSLNPTRKRHLVEWYDVKVDSDDDWEAQVLLDQAVDVIEALTGTLTNRGTIQSVTPGATQAVLPRKPAGTEGVAHISRYVATLRFVLGRERSV